MIKKILLLLCVCATMMCLDLFADEQKETEVKKQGVSKKKDKEEVVSPRKIDDLVKQLGAKDYKARKKADEAIRELPPSALDRLKDHLKKAKDPEVKIRLKKIVDDKVTPRITLDDLNKIMLPKIEFRQANINDCFDFLEAAGDKKFKIKRNFNARNTPTITFSASQITVSEALEIITQISSLNYTLEDGIVVVTPGNAAQNGFGAPVNDPFAAQGFVPF